MSDLVEAKGAIQDIPGLTYRQFDHWCHMGYIRTARLSEETAEGSGNRRTITEDEIRVVTLMAELVGLGFTPVTSAPLARTLALGITATFGRFRIQRAS